MARKKNIVEHGDGTATPTTSGTFGGDDSIKGASIHPVLPDDGGGLRCLSAKDITLDDRTAANLLGAAHPPAERDVRPNWIKYLQAAMYRQTFIPQLVTLVVADCSSYRTNGNSYVRCNGQHTCWALRGLNQHEMPGLAYEQVRLLTFECKNDEELRRLYASIDRGSPRSPGHILNSHLFGTPEYENIQKSVLQLCGKGLRLWMWETKNERSIHDMDEVAALMLRERHDLCISVCRFFNMLGTYRDRAHLNRAPVWGSILATFDANEKAGVDFWTPVQSGLGFKAAGDPRKRLREFLTSSRVEGKQKKVDPTLRVTSQEEMLRGCFHCWNKWMDGQTISQLKISSLKTRPKLRRRRKQK